MKNAFLPAEVGNINYENIWGHSRLGDLGMLVTIRDNRSLGRMY